MRLETWPLICLEHVVSEAVCVCNCDVRLYIARLDVRIRWAIRPSKFGAVAESIHETGIVIIDPVLMVMRRVLSEVHRRLSIASLTLLTFDDPYPSIHEVRPGQTICAVAWAGSK